MCGYETTGYNSVVARGTEGELMTRNNFRIVGGSPHDA